MSSSPLAVFAIPSYGTVSAQWVMYRLSLSTPLGSGVHDIWQLDNTLSIAEKRNALIRQALDVGARYIFFIGDDMLLPSHAFVQLLQQLQRDPANRKIITGLYMSRSNPPQPMIWRGYMEGSYYSWHVGELFEVDWAGCDVLLIDLSIFRGDHALPEPWFSQDYVFSSEQVRPSSISTEDIYFYEKVRAHGLSIWCDTGVCCIHQDRNSGEMFYLPTSWPQAQGGSFIPTESDVSTLRTAYLTRVPIRSMLPPSTPEHPITVYGEYESPNPPTVRCDLHALPEADQVFDHVHVRDALEFYPPEDAPALIREWTRVLKIGGSLHLRVPNFAAAAQAVATYSDSPDSTPPPTPSHWDALFSGDRLSLPIRNGFTLRSLQKAVDFAWGTTPVHTKDQYGVESDTLGCLDLAGGEVTVTDTIIEITATKRCHQLPATIGPDGPNTAVWRLPSWRDVSIKVEAYTNAPPADPADPPLSFDAPMAAFDYSHVNGNSVDLGSYAGLNPPVDPTFIPIPNASLFSHEAAVAPIHVPEESYVD